MSVLAGQMTQAEFLSRVRSTSPNVLARDFLLADSVRIFADQELYNVFREKVRTLLGPVESVAIVGSANWRFSLNPEKKLREFGTHSDVDVAVVSLTKFNDLWEEMRNNHRKHFYSLSYEGKQRVLRNGENVYSGFISPDWIPNRDPRQSYAYKQLLNTLSDETVGFLKVKMMFFKNPSETIDYYARGFRTAGRRTNEI